MRRPPRVVHLGKYYPPARGGIESHVQDLARAQAARGAEVDVLCVEHRDASGRDVTWSALGRTRTTVESDGPVRLTRLGRRGNLARLDVCPRLPAALLQASRRADVLHLHVPNPTMAVPLLLLPLDRCRLVVTHHSDLVRQRVLGRAYRPLEHFLYRRAAALIATSPPYAAASPLLQAHRDKVHVIPLGLDLSPFLDPAPGARAEAARLQAAYPGPLWVSVGRLVYYKGLETAVRALRELQGTLLLVGVGPLQARLKSLARQQGVAGRLVFLGEVGPETLVGAYLAATALLFPSDARSEAFGLAQVEAMASACPVVNCAIPGSGVPWVAANEVAALTVLPGDPQALAQAASRLLREPDLRARLGQQGRARARAELSAEVAADRTLRLYASL